MNMKKMVMASSSPSTMQFFNFYSILIELKVDLTILIKSPSEMN